MDFQLTEQQELIRKEVATLARSFSLDYWLEKDRKAEYPADWIRAFAQAGWLGMIIPEDYGGSGLGVTEATVMLHEICAAGAGTTGASPIHFYLFPPMPVIKHGSEDLKRRYLPRIAAGEIVMSFGVTEPNAGTDTSRIQTRAERHGDGYVVTGRKVWNTNAQHATHTLLLARTSPREAARPFEGMTLFFTEFDRAKITVREIEKLGRAAVDSNEIFIDGLEIPAANVVGEVGRGFYHLLDSLNPERIFTGIEAVGIGRAALDRAVQYAKERVVFDRPIGQNQAIAHPLALAWAKLETAGVIGLKAAWLFDNGRPCGAESNTAKLMAAEAAWAAGLPFRAVAQPKPVRIGLLTVKTGPLALCGIQMEQGTIRFFKDRNYTLAGRKVELVVADTGVNPAGTKTKTQELVERDNVDMIFGPLAAFELLAITDYAAQAKMPILSLAAAEDMTQRRPNPYFVRASGTSAQYMHPLADYAAKELKLKRVITIADDFAFGHEQMAGFQRVFEDAGGRVVKKLWPPLVTPDYTPYIAQITGVDAVIQGFAGSNPLKFMKQYQDQGLKLPVLAGAPACDDALLKSFGDEVLGVISVSAYTGDLDTPSNKRLIDGMVKDYGNIPGLYSAGLYINGQVAEAALEKTGGKTDDREAFIRALRSVSLTDTPRGPFTFDRLGNVVGTFYVRRCERKGDKLVNTTIKSYPKVSQFWIYDEKWFLSQPVYSRDYPPLKS